MAEIVGELDRVAEFVAEFEIDGNVGVEMLLNADEFKSRWTLVGGRTHDAAAHDGTARTLRKQRNDREHEHKSRCNDQVGETAFTMHCFFLSGCPAGSV